MRVRLLGWFAALAAVAAFGVGSSFADDSKKDACGDCDKGKAAKKDACGDCDKDKAAKKDKCDGCADNVSKMPKGMYCKDCANSEKLPCAKCAEMVDGGKVFFLPVSGMTCGNCEGVVAKKLEGEAAVAKHMVTHRGNGVAFMVEAGKSYKLTDMAKLLEGTSFKIDEEKTPVHGRMTLVVKGVDCDGCKKPLCEAIGKLLEPVCGECTVDGVSKTAYATITLKIGTKVTIKQLRDALTSVKFSLADIEFRAPEAKAGKS